jgi:hypothetical protein
MTEITDDLLEIQILLREDKDGAKSRALAAQFAAWRQSLKKELDVGVTKERFATLSALIDAIDAAGDIVKSESEHYLQHRKI